MSGHPASSGVVSRQDPSNFLSLAETLSSLIALIQDDRLIYVNPAGCALLGRSPDWYRGRNFWEVVHPDDREAAVARGRARLAGIPQPKRLTERLIHADGRTVWMDYSVDVIQLDGRPTTLVTGNDVTDRLRIEEELKRSEARLAEAQRISHIGSWEWDVAADVITWSDECCRIFGRTPADFGGKIAGYVQLLHPDDRERARQVVETALRVGGAFAFEHRIVRPDGTVRSLHGRGEVFLGPDGAPVRLAGTAQDITERKGMEDALRESEERFRSLCTQAPVMLMAFEPDGRIRDVSNYWLQTMGYAREEVVGRDGGSLITPESRARLAAAIEENQRNNHSVIRNLPLKAVRKDGSTLDLLATSVAQVGDDGVVKGAICVEINLSDLQRAEAALRESEERYRALVEHAPDAIMVLDVDLDRFVDVNDAAERLFGHSREKLLTMGPLDFCPEHQAGGRPSCDMVEDEHRKVLDGGVASFDAVLLHASGREISVQIRLSRLPAAGRRLLRCAVTDVTELKQLQEKVRHSEKLAAVGVLAAGVAHEIGNPLMAISMAAQSLERRACDAYAQGKLGLIREHVDRLSRIVRQMGDLSRPPSGKRADCDLNLVVRRAVDMVRYDKRARSAEVVYELAEALPAVDAVEDELVQVCINLALNAFDAMAGNPEEKPRRLTVRSGRCPAGVLVSFVDTGPGVSPEHRPRLFEPFFTTKEAGRGMGLGLSVSYRILQEHGGRLRLDESHGSGARFDVELPLGRPS